MQTERVTADWLEDGDDLLCADDRILHVWEVHEGNDGLWLETPESVFWVSPETVFRRVIRQRTRG